ncbi:MAG: SDR family oxidoreductase [Spirochaetes bacterium]|nr:SDR family oxidoreductase [Spirochaetota bacterium]
MDLGNKVALITGGGSGIGAGIARRFVKDGAKVCIAGRRKEMLEKVAASLPSESITICQGDVQKPEDIDRMIKTAADFGGKLNVLVNDAGIDNRANIADIKLELWNQVIATNLTGPMLTMKGAIPHMIKEGGGSIINISSLASVRCIPDMPAYCASKSGLNMLSQQIALDYGKHNIRCNVICPGATKSYLENPPEPLTDEMKENIGNMFSMMTKFTPMQRPGDTSDISSMASFLASDESTIMTGAVIMIDSGTSIVDVNGTAINESGMKWGGDRR